MTVDIANTLDGSYSGGRAGLQLFTLATPTQNRNDEPYRHQTQPVYYKVRHGSAYKISPLYVAPLCQKSITHVSP